MCCRGHYFLLNRRCRIGIERMSKLLEAHVAVEKAKKGNLDPVWRPHSLDQTLADMIRAEERLTELIRHGVPSSRICQRLEHLVTERYVQSHMSNPEQLDDVVSQLRHN